jgi:predicted TIM-barrel fold metal-dependent hydrolase
VVVRTMSEAARIRSELDHPVVDGDGHTIEHRVVLESYVRDHGRGDIADRAQLFRWSEAPWLTIPLEERRRNGVVVTPFWVAPGDADYLATVSIPGRYYERLGEAGIDFSVLYPTRGISVILEQDEECRVELCRLFNEFLAEEYGPYADKLTPAAVVPMNNPDEAVRELEHVAALGLKVALIPSYELRTRDAATGRMDARRWMDTFGLDSAYDYDPVWAKAVELGLPLACHSGAMGFPHRASPSNYMFNHIGHFAAAGEALAKSLFFGGVTRRFPALRVALLEGGVAVGVRVYGDLVARYSKRGRHVLDRLNPSKLDVDELGRIMARYGGRFAQSDPAQIARDLTTPTLDVPDDFALSGVESVEDIRDQFCRNFYWGCEGDDPLVGLAFDPRVNPLGARVPAIMGSDIGHWDVPEFTEPLTEAYELLEHGLIDADAFRAFVFENPVRLYGSLNPTFFAGTSIEGPAARVSR